MIDAAIAGRIELATSAALIEELNEVLGRAKFSRKIAGHGVPVGALAAQTDLIVSGDKRVRNLKAYHGIWIVNVTEALALIAKL